MLFPPAGQAADVTALASPSLRASFIIILALTNTRSLPCLTPSRCTPGEPPGRREGRGGGRGEIYSRQQSADKQATNVKQPIISQPTTSNQQPTITTELKTDM